MANVKTAPEISKMEVVRRVISAHGEGTMPVEIVRLARTEHGVRLNADVASNYKSAVLRKMAGGGKRKGKRGPKPGWKKAAALANGTKTTTSQISLEDIAAVKKLVDQLGAEKVRQLAQVLAK